MTALKKLSKRRRNLQFLTWLGLPLVAVGGWFYPPLGFLLFGCMLGAVGIAFFKGRAWCDWMCPRGGFYDLLFNKISPNREIPAFLRSTRFRGLMVGLIFVVLGTQLFFAWGNLNQMGLAMVRLLTITTIVGIILAVVYHPRTWCHVCPMGTLANWVAKGKQPILIDPSCVGCKICSTACPMQLVPYKYAAEGTMTDNDCIKCSSCIVSCPKQALSFTDCRKEASVA